MEFFEFFDLETCDEFLAEAEPKRKGLKDERKCSGCCGWNVKETLR